MIAALPGELKRLVRDWDVVPVDRNSGVRLWQQMRGDDELIAVCAGMGADAARRAFTAAEHTGALDLVISAGWAGATSADFLPGSCLMFSTVIDVQTGERFGAEGGPLQLRLATAVRVADVAEKRRLSESYGAAAVDMEAATVARIARMREIPFVCIKGISDGLDSDLPDLNPYIDDRGQMKMPAFLSHVALRPRLWPGLATLGRHSAEAAKGIAKSVDRYLVTKNIAEVLREGGVGG